MNREPGYYWVKLNEKWRIWELQDGVFINTGDDNGFSEINESRILMPGEGVLNSIEVNLFKKSTLNFKDIIDFIGKRMMVVRPEDLNTMYAIAEIAEKDTQEQEDKGVIFKRINTAETLNDLSSIASTYTNDKNGNFDAEDFIKDVDEKYIIIKRA